MNDFTVNCAHLSLISGSLYTMTETNGDSATSLFKDSLTNTEWWRAYGNARPRYSNTFWRLLDSYHDEHIENVSQQRPFGLMHDIGCGPGNIVEPLAERFEHIIASDVSDSALAAARALLEKDMLSKTTLVNSPGEKLGFALHAELCLGVIASSAPLPSNLKNTADMVLISECIPLMDADLAVKSAAQLLRSSGTLAVTFYGVPLFSHDERGRRCRKVMADIINAGYAHLNKDGHIEKLWEKVGPPMLSSLDTISFAADTWKDVERHKWNNSVSLSFFDVEALGFKIPWASKVQAQEKVVVHEESEESPQDEMWTFDQLRKYITSLYPALQEILSTDGEIIGMLEELSRTVGGPGMKAEVKWPSVTILATKR